MTEELAYVVNDDDIGLISLVNKGLYRDLKLSHLDILNGRNPVDLNIDDFYTCELKKNVVIPALLESGVIEKDFGGGFSTKYSNIVFSVTDKNRNLFLRSLGLTFNSFVSKVIRLKDFSWNRKSAHVIIVGRKDVLEENLAILSEALHNIKNALKSKNSDENMELELIYASLRRKEVKA